MNNHGLENHFLIAMPALKGSLFGNTVSVVCQHDTQGAFALIINKTLPQTLADIFNQMNLPLTHLSNPDQAILSGGPVHPEAGFILHSDKGDWESTLNINETLFLTSSRDILSAISKHEGPRDYLFILGYAGWSSGQIEAELEQNSWLHSPISTDIIFSTPPEKLSERVIAKLGIDPSRISSQIGHA